LVAAEIGDGLTYQARAGYSSNGVVFVPVAGLSEKMRLRLSLAWLGQSPPALLRLVEQLCETGLTLGRAPA
jgi:hypothetical protein